MKLTFKFEKKDLLQMSVILLLALIMYFTIGYQLWAFFLYGGIYFGVKCVKVEGEYKSEKIKYAVAALQLVVLAAVTVCLVQYLLLEPENLFRMKPWRFLLNITLAAGIYCGVQVFATGTAWTCIISHGALLIFAFVNFFIYLFRGNEFTFADMRSIGTGLSVASNYRFRLNEQSVYVLMASVILFLIARRLDVKYEKPWKTRGIFVAMATGFLVFTFLNTNGINTETWEQKGTYKNGYLLNFTLGIRDSFVAPPDGYEVANIKKLENKYKAPANAGEIQPTVIVIMSESFTDLSVLGKFRTNEPITPFLDSLTENTLRGSALSSVYGAKTPNSEWEFLTSNSMAFLPAGSVVYQQYIDEQPASLVATMKELDYTCVAMHPYYETGWSRNLIYPTMGFDEMYFIDDFDETQILRSYITDQELYEQIIARYEKKRPKENLFYMTISMQNHGGYKDTYENFQENYYKTGVSYTDANQYLSLLHESDKALEYLISYFQEVEEPVEIVFFGDHFPGLSTGFYRLLNGKGMSGLTLDELQKLYTVPFFIWTNYDTPEEEVPITSLNFLAGYALERAGITLPPYQQFLAEFRDVVPAINSQGYYSATTGEYKHLEDATGIEANWILDYNQLQYNAMFDWENRSELLFPRVEENQ